MLGINYESTQWSILYLDASAKAMFDALSLHLEKKVTISCLQLYSTMVSIGIASANKNKHILSKSDFFCLNIKCCFLMKIYCVVWQVRAEWHIPGEFSHAKD